MSSVEVKVDLHVHSRYSDNGSSWFLKAAKASECYTSPRRVYELATARGMTLVTIADHDEVAGAVELCSLAPNTFISEEVSGRFPEDGCIVHIIVVDISEEQHREIQRLRRNVYELSAYLRQQQIEHVLCHPLAPVNRRLDATHIKRCLLMFRNIEARNGTRDPALEQEVRRIVGRLTPDRLARWAEEFPQAPWVNREARYAFTGGSDDHAALSVARAYTSFLGECSGAGLAAALREGRTTPSGLTARPEVLSHNVYGVLASALAATGQLPALEPQDGDGGSPAMTRAIERWGGLLGGAAAGTGPAHELDLGVLAREGHTDATQKKLNQIVEQVLVGSSRDAWGGLRDSILAAQPMEAAERISDVLKALFLSAPALLAGRAFSHDRSQARSLGERLAGSDGPARALRVLIVSDTVDETNGVAIGLRRLVAHASSCGLDARLVGLGDDVHVTTDADGVVRIPAVMRHRLADYPQIHFGIPHLPSLLDYVIRQDIDLVQISTPGPMGFAAMAAARLAGVPVIGQYHTDVPEYVTRITGDSVLGDLAGRVVGWFYGSLDRVLAPSAAARDRLISLGVTESKVRLVPRGIDLDLFSPARRDEHAFDGFGASEDLKILYVGRLSREKGLDALVTAFAALSADIPNAKLLLVGDGPYAASLAGRLPPERVVFAGERKGEELARFYASSDVFVLPSETETFGNVVVEAQAAGLPVIVASRGAAHENVQPGVTGLVVDAQEPHEIEQALRKLLTQPRLRLQMSRAAAQFARRYDLRSAAEGTLALYRSFLEGGEIRPRRRHPSVMLG